MDRYYGFDLGDAESAVSCLNKNDMDLTLETPRAPSHVLIKMTREFRGSSLWEKQGVL